MKKLLLIAAFAALAMLMVMPVAHASSKGKVKIAYVEWDCATSSTYVAKAALEKMGYEVEVLPVAAAAMWQAVGTGDVDAMVTAWLPVTHADYLKKVQDKVENVATISGGAKLGWAVPAYVGIDSMEEINAHADKFDGKIIGIDPGSGLMQLSEKAIEQYGMDKMELMEGSGATMTAALGDAIKHKKWIIATGWSPHWMFGTWELKYLADPKGILGGEEHIDTVVNKGLKTKMPEVYAFFKKFKWASPEQLQMVMAWNQADGATPEASAARFLKENAAQVDGWIK